jgi:hypothetical protein
MAFLATAAWPALAELEQTKLTGLLKESELIIRARVIEASLDGNGYSGHARLQVQEVYRGAYGEATITVRWAAEVHDQRIDRVDETRLLFLKKNKDGSYNGAQYGRSYWPLAADHETGRAATIYVYPINMIEIDIPGALKETSVFPPTFPLESKRVKLPVIFLEDIVRIISAQASQ